MRYQNTSAFQKHLTNASPDYLSRCYLILATDDYERSQALRMVLTALHMPMVQLVSLSGTEATYREVANALLSPTLFGGLPVVRLDEAEKMGKKDLEMLQNLVEQPDLSGYLLCGARSKLGAVPAFEKRGVVLDLTEEKPWEKEKRLVLQISERALSAGKRLAADAASLLLERLGTDAALLDQEIDKLLCYVGERPTIERADIFRATAERSSATLWQNAEVIVWEGGEPPTEAVALQGLIPMIRSQLQIGLKIIHLQRLQTPREEWGAFLPRIWPKILEKRIGQAIVLGEVYFQKGLQRLFEIELLSRSGSSREQELLDLFCLTIHRGGV
ncbi:MAG: hypothetical protein HY861_04180 [Chlamydiia bacterium]|nr:hypothetical protein [Chlamydiia bacterium]